MAGMANWQAQISIDIDDLKKRIKVAEGELDKIEKKEHKVKLDIDTKTLENAVIKLDRMLESLGKGSGDFKEFENLSKQLSSITTDINNISKAFSVMNDGSDFANSIKSIDTSLTALSNHFVSEMSGRMTSSIKEVKSTLSDVGDGGELAPLLQTINKIENAINELSTSVKGIGLNMNIDVGSDPEMETKVQSKIANALQAYQRLFDHIKMSSAGGQIITDKFFDFDINQYDTMMGKLQAYKKFIDNMRKEAKTQFNGKDVLYQDTEKSYWTQASAAMGQVTKAFNEMNVASDTNPLADMFGKTDLSEVISQLGLIVAKLEEISNTTTSFKNIFDNGFNITASVEEIDKLTNRVKELEDELSKVKLNPVSVDKSNISSENPIVESQNKIQKELKETQENSIVVNNSLQNDAKETAKNIHYVTNALGEVTVAYRGLRDSMAAGLSSDRYHGGTFWTDNLELAKEYSQWTKVESANLEMLNPLEIEGNGSNWNDIEWLGHNSDEASRKIIKARKDIDSLRESIKYLGYDISKINLTDNNKSSFVSYETVIDALSNRMSDVAEAAENTKEYIASIKGEEFAKNYEDPILKVAIEELNLFTDAVQRYREVALDDSNTYGLFDTNKFVELAKNSGYDGVIFKNIIDSYSGDVRDISNVMVTFEQNQTHFLETISVDPVERIRANFKSVYGDISELAEKSKEEYSEIFRQMDSIETNFKNGNIDNKERANSLKKIYQENPEIPSFFNYLNQNAFATSFNKALDNSNFDEQANLILDFIRTAKNDWEALENSVSNGKLDFENVNSLVTEFGFNDIVNDYISKIQSLPEIEKQARRGLRDFSDVDDMEKNISEIETLYPILDKFKDQLVKISSAEEDVGENAKLISSIYQEYLSDFNNKWNSFETETPMKDVFQGEAEKSGMDAIASSTEEAVQAKKDFATANESVQSSIDDSKSPLQLEAELMDQIAKSAREAADAKKEFVEANKQVKDSADASNGSTKKDKYKDKSKVSEDEYSDSRFASIANKKLSDNGFTILGESVNTELVDGLVKVNAKIKTTEGTWKTFSAKIDADGNMFEQRFRTITKGVDKLETELENFGRETSPALTYQETLDKANEIRDKLQLGGEYSIKVDSNELVTITKKLSDVNSTATSVTQTFKSAEDAIQNFGRSSSNSAEKTSIALKGVKEKNKEVKASADETVISVDKEISALEKAVSKFESQAAGLAIKPDGQHQFSSWKNDLNELNEKIDEYNSKIKYLKENNIVDGEQVDEVKNLRDEIEQTINVMTKTPQAKRGWTDIGASKAAEKVANVLKQNTKMSKEAKDAIRAYYNELRSGNPSQPIDEILVKVNQLVQKERELGRVGKSFGEIFKEKVIYGGAAQLAGMVGFYDVINVGRNTFNVIKELDTALVDLKKTTAMNSSQLEEFYFDSNDVAKQMGVTTQAIIDQASAWSRLNKIGLLYGDI